MTNLLGLTLAEAQAVCASREEGAPEDGGREVRVVETGPPFEPRHYTPIWGEWRVLRAQEQNGILELLVARELLREEKVVRDSAPSKS
jgi:hypothetical protein